MLPWQLAEIKKKIVFDFVSIMMFILFLFIYLFVCLFKIWTNTLFYCSELDCDCVFCLVLLTVVYVTD